MHMRSACHIIYQRSKAFRHVIAAGELVRRPQLQVLQVQYSQSLKFVY